MASLYTAQQKMPNAKINSASFNTPELQKKTDGIKNEAANAFILLPEMA